MKHFVPLLQSDHALIMALKADNPILMFGAGLYIQPAIHALSQYNRQPVAIIDNSPEKWKTEIFNIPTLSPELAIEKFPDAIIIISAAPQYIEEIQKQSIELGWKSIFNCVALLTDFSYGQQTFTSGISSLHFELDRYIYDYFLKFSPDKLIIPSIDIMITEKCSLKCRDCSNLMQYYVNPQNLNFEEVFNSLDILMDHVDHVLEFRVLGGETFVNKNAFKFINRLRKYRKKTRVAVYSNGTIIPKGKNLSSLIGEDIYLRISNYGAASINIDKIVEIFDSLKIYYDIEKFDAWQDCSTIKKRKRSAIELEKVYSNCCVNNFLTLLKGNLFICPFAANANNLKALPRFSGEHIVLNKKDRVPKIRQTLLNMLRDKKYFSACNFCAGRPLDDTPLPVAVQIKNPLPYNRYY